MLKKFIPLFILIPLVVFFYSCGKSSEECAANEKEAYDFGQAMRQYADEYKKLAPDMDLEDAIELWSTTYPTKFTSNNACVQRGWDDGMIGVKKKD
jgi:hypothetical protein